MCFQRTSEGGPGYLVFSFSGRTVSEYPFIPEYFPLLLQLERSRLALSTQAVRLPVSSGEHAFTDFWLCTTTASGCPPLSPFFTQENKSFPTAGRRGCVLTPQAGSNQHGVANGDGKGSRGAQRDAASQLLR